MFINAGLFCNLLNKIKGVIHTISSTLNDLKLHVCMVKLVMSGGFLHLD